MEFNMNEENVGEPDGEFAFETDHLALRSNKDYGELLKYIVKLEAQKTKALKDLEYLAEAQNKALEEPIAFVQKLQTGKINFPPRQVISDLPKIDWDQYGIDSTQDDTDKDIKPDLEELTPKVRGRQFTDSKPETFNQLWSIEEQKRLEELLEVYREEPIEARRYKKIAEGLGTRTPLQVMSRMQKYFAKLAKAGLPIPGRAPKGFTYREKNKPSSAMFYKKSSFFPQLHVPVKMEAADESYISESVSTTDTNSGDRAMLELLKAAKEQRILDESFPVWQTKTTCVGCQKTKFVGARWTDNAGTDYCTDCVVKLLPSEKLIPIRN